MWNLRESSNNCWLEFSVVCVVLRQPATMKQIATTTAILFSLSFGLPAFSLPVFGRSATAGSDSSISVWPDLAPGEISREAGTAEPPRAKENPPVTRVVRIRRPTLDVFLPAQPNGTAVLVLPGGGFSKVVPDKEGSEAAPWLNGLGITVFVLRYRTNEATPGDEPAYQRPLQDAQRALRLIRSNAAEWRLQTDRVGVLGFSAGGQVAVILQTSAGRASYESLDEIDQQSCVPDFSLLIYPWQVLDGASGELLPAIQISEKTPPSFLVHTHDDASSSLGSVLIYSALKRSKVAAELHVYENGGHGYGMRPVGGSSIGSWPDRATEWLVRRQLAHESAAQPPLAAKQSNP